MTNFQQNFEPDDLDAIGQAAALFVADRFGHRHGRKHLQADLDVSPATIDRLKRGSITWPLFGRMVRTYGRAFADQVLAPLLGTNSSSTLIERMVRDADLCQAAAYAAHRRISGSRAGAVGRGGFLAGLGRVDRAVVARGQGVAVGGVAVQDRQLGQGASELRQFLGAVDDNSDIGLDTLVGPQAQLLDAWRDADGALTDSLINRIEAVRLIGLASLFDNQMRVLRIGQAVGLWSEDQRRAAVGKDLSELPGPRAYGEAVRASLGDAVDRGLPLHHRIAVRVGDVARRYRRLALPLPKNGAVLSVSMLETI